MNGRKVLVIEDNGDLRSMLRDALENAGFDVAVAADGVTGLELQKRRPAEVVVTDLLMPEKDGIETIAELRKAYPRTKIVAMSGHSSPRTDIDYLSIARELGADATLRKPFSPQQLVEEVRQVLAAASDSR